MYVRVPDVFCMTFAPLVIHADTWLAGKYLNVGYLQKNTGNMSDKAGVKFI